MSLFNIFRTVDAYDAEGRPLPRLLATPEGENLDAALDAWAQDEGEDSFVSATSLPKGEIVVLGPDGQETWL